MASTGGQVACSGRPVARPDPGASARRFAEGPDLLIWIGIFKLFKCVMLLTAGVLTLRLANGNMLVILSHWVSLIRADPDNRFIHFIVAKLFATDPRRLDLIAVGTFLYASIFGTEGIGLLLRKRWAEYFTIVSTGLLIPLEMYELIRHVTALKALILLFNVTIVAYLIWQVRRTAHRDRSLHERTAPHH